jgi:WhiB family redox-sensing transcriptional regulator
MVDQRSSGKRVTMIEMFDTEVQAPVGPTDWMETAACNGKSDLFFAPFAERPEARVRREARARLICQGCPGLEMCRTYARTNRELGFWGGESESERSDAGFPPTTPIIGRKRIAEERARSAMAAVS